MLYNDIPKNFPDYVVPDAVCVQLLKGFRVSKSSKRSEGIELFVSYALFGEKIAVFCSKNTSE